MKAGIKTTEFWLVVSVVAGSLIGTLGDLIANGTLASGSVAAVVAGAALTAIYTVARTLSKGGQP